MATPAQRTNTWTLDEWYAQSVAGTTGGYNGEGQAFAWGMNNDGVIGLNDRTQRSSPAQIPGTTWSSLSITDYSHASFGLKTDGSLWSWGQGDDGMLGQGGPNASKSSPVQIGTDVTWRRIRSGSFGGMATKTDGTLWMWGKNGQGNLGMNNRTAYSSPRQIPGTWSDNFDGSSFIGLATKTDGTLWVWGGQYNGSLGQNNTTQYSSPIQIPGTDWPKTFPETTRKLYHGQGYFGGAIVVS